MEGTKEVSAFKEVPTEILHKMCFEKIEEIQSYLKKGRAVYEERVRSGDNPFGLKIVDKIGNSTWCANIDKFKTTLERKLTKDVCYTKKFISPTQARKLLKQVNTSTKFNNLLEAAIHRPVTGTKLVAGEHESPALSTYEELLGNVPKLEAKNKKLEVKKKRKVTL